MESKYLIDSNVIIYYLSNQLPAKGTDFVKTIIDIQPNLSIITKIEVLGFNAIADEADSILSFINDSVIFELAPEVVSETIAIRKNHKIKLPDAIIAATALVNQMILVTRNTSDFMMIQNLQLIDPFLL